MSPGLLVLAVVSLVAAACQPGSHPPPGDPLPTFGDIAVPLSTSGGEIVDGYGDPVIVQGVNWFGFETGTNVVHGLWSRDYKDMLAQMSGLGYNTIRLPWSLDSIYSTQITSVDTSLGANSDFVGKTPLEAMDLVIQAAADEGLLVLLDNHRLNDQAIPELWYGDGYTEQDWIDAWVLLAERYAGQDNVIGADLKNEPHGAATWGTGDPATDWRLAAQRGGNAVLSVNPNWLIVVEGIGGSVAGQQLPSHWWGGNLEGVANWPVELDVANRLVYSPHEYGPGVFDQPWFSDPDMAAVLLDRWEKGFAYIAEQGIAPILVGEFGGREVGYDTTEGQWQNQFVDFLAERGYSWTYWSWNPNSTDTGGILADDWLTVNADKQLMLDRLLAASPGTGGGGGSTTTTSAPVTTTTVPAMTSTTAPASTTSVPTSSTTVPAGGIAASVVVTNDWGTGYCAQFAIANGTSLDASGLGLQFELVDATITSTWNGTAATADSTVSVVLESWGQAVEAGVTEENFGYCANIDGPSPYPSSPSVT